MWRVIGINELIERKTIAVNELIIFHAEKTEQGFKLTIDLYDLGTDNYKTIIQFIKTHNDIKLNILNRKIFFLLEDRSNFKDCSSNFNFLAVRSFNNLKDAVEVLNQILNNFDISIGIDSKEEKWEILLWQKRF